jgi:TfoX/Sxy family transcriptional regulator of competence genes
MSTAGDSPTFDARIANFVTPKRSAAVAKRPLRTAPESIVNALRESVASLSGMEERAAFGYPAAFIDGKMFAGVFQRSIVTRLSPADRKRALQVPGAKVFEAAAGFEVSGYIDFPRAIAGDAELIRPWIKRAYAYAKSLHRAPAAPRKTRGSDG